MKFTEIKSTFPDIPYSECRCLLRPVKPTVKVGERGELLGREFPKYNFGDIVPSECLDMSFPVDLSNPSAYAELIDGHASDRFSSLVHVDAIHASKLAKDLKSKM